MSIEAKLTLQSISADGKTLQFDCSFPSFGDAQAKVTVESPLPLAPFKVGGVYTSDFTFVVESLPPEAPAPEPPAET